MKITIPKLSLVALVGPSGAGKSTFAREHFLPTEVLSSDFCRGLVSDDQNSQAATNDAFEVLNFIAEKRLATGRLTVVDATNVQKSARRSLITLAKKFHVLPVAVVLNIPEKVCRSRNDSRPDRDLMPHVVRQQASQLRGSIKQLRKEGFRYVFVLNSEEEVAQATIERVPLWTDRTDVSGPFDIIGDVHGCAVELQQLLEALGYVPTDVPECDPGWKPITYSHPEGRRAVFVGDLVDRGPQSLLVLSIARNMVRSRSAFCVPGNHDDKLLRKLRGTMVKTSYGLEQTLEDLATVPEEHQPGFQKQLIEFLDGLVSHLVFDSGRLVVAHAGLPENMHGRSSGQVRSFALYGDTTGEKDEYGLPVRRNWAAGYRGSSTVVYGHTPVATAEWLNNTMNVDTGCVFGGSLTALRYPEQAVVSVRADQQYCEPARPFLTGDGRSAQQVQDDLLYAEDVSGKRFIHTELQHNVTIREENATAAMEVMSRFAIDPRWLIYLPPTMSPCETSRRDGYLEHPDQAFEYFASQNVERVVCQQKHMGSRCVVVVCQNPEAAAERFGVTGGGRGAVYTRTGRAFFRDSELEAQFLNRLADALTESGFWERFGTTWVCLDCELMPWSAKAQELLRNQYAAVGAAGRAAVPQLVSALSMAEQRMASMEAGPSEEVAALAAFRQRMETTEANLHRFTEAYRQYCWPVQSLQDYRLAPFHLLATEGGVHTDRDHEWHLRSLANVCLADPDFLLATNNRTVQLDDAEQVQAAVNWWQELTASGGEGMVVKPLDFVSHNGRRLIQPAMKCRGVEYLRIIYGANYDQPKNLQRLRNRSTGRKRSLALREFALGVEGLQRFVKQQPLRKVHECVFGVLALESEPVDPRL